MGSPVLVLLKSVRWLPKDRGLRKRASLSSMREASFW